MIVVTQDNIATLMAGRVRFRAEPGGAYFQQLHRFIGRTCEIAADGELVVYLNDAPNRVTIQPACLRDASFIAANLRPLDNLEVRCQLPDNVAMWQLMHHHLASAMMAHVAYLDGQPVMVFGVGLLNAACASVWALGTKDTRHVVPAVTKFFHEQIVPELLQRGVRTVEARSIDTHHDAHRWMENLGARQHGPAFEYGKDGEYFLLFRWTVASYRSIYPETSSESS